MAEGGGARLWMDEEESSEIGQLMMLSFMGRINAEELKKMGDDKFRAKEYHKAEAIYSIALHCPKLINAFEEVAIISEQLFRKRAECLFKMGKYLEAVNDSETAIGIARHNNNLNLVIKSLFIKMKAIESLGDYVQALPYAVLCKHLRPNCDKTLRALQEVKEKLSEEIKKNDELVHVVVITMLKFADEDMGRNRMETALEYLNELLELLYFKFLPGVLLRRADCLLNLGRHGEAKDDCAKVLYFESGNERALEMMDLITHSLQEAGRAKQKMNTTEKREPDVEMQTSASPKGNDQQPILFQSTVEKRAFDVGKNDFSTEGQDQQPASLFQDELQVGSSTEDKNRTNHQGASNSAAQKHITEIKEDHFVPLEENATEAKLEPDQVQSVAAKDYAKVEKKRKKNKQKKRKKKKKKAQQKTKSAGADQKPSSNTNSPSPDGSADEDESQETDSVIGDTDISLGYSASTNTDMNTPFSTLTSTFRASVVSDDEDALPDDFIKVQYSRRPHDQAAKSETFTKVPDPHHQLQGQPPQRAIMTTEVSCPKKVITAQPNPKRNTEPQLQQMHYLSIPKVQENATRSKEKEMPDFSSCFSLKEFPALGNVSSQTSPKGSQNTFNTACDNFNESDAPKVPPMKPLRQETFQRFKSEESKISSQGMPGALSSSSMGSSLSCSTRRGGSESSSIPVTLSEDYQRNGKSENPSVGQPMEFNDPSKIPEGVFVVCDHFLQDNRKRPFSISIKIKTCKACENHGLMKYALWNNINRCWQAIRPYPAFNVPPKVTLDVCRHFSYNMPCPREPCTFPHGKVELSMWTMERQGVLPTPQESFSVAAQSGRRPPAPITGATQERSGDLSISSSLSLTALEEFPLLGAVSSQIAITKPTYNTTSPVWISNGASGASFSEVLSAARPAIVPSQIAEGEAVSNTQRSTAHIPRNAFSSTCPTRPDTPTQIIGAGIISTERVLTNNLENIGPSSRVTHSNVSGRSTPVQSVGNSIIRTSKVLQSGVLNDSRKTPDNVFVVCDDFLEKHRRRPASIYEKIKACKGCENRSKLRYAVWSDNSKEWQVIRPYPIEKVPANVAFSVCRQYALKVPCLWSACSFAHGQEELLMWTMEREGVLPTPRETLMRSLGKATVVVCSSDQPSPQLKYRPSPPGVTNGAYKLCRSCYTRERCRFGRGCIFAHSIQELNEWEQEYQRKEREKRMKELQDKDEILSMEMATEILKAPAEDLAEYLPGVEITCTPPDLSITLQDNNDTHACQWTFNLLFKANEVGYLRHVLLLHRYHNCYQLSEIRVGCYQENRGCESYKTCYTAKFKEFWYKAPEVNLSGKIKVSLTVSFNSTLYGNFDQCIVFDFGRKPYLVQKLNADVRSESLSQTPIVSQHSLSATIWDESSVEVVRFVHGTDESLQGEHLSRTYSLRKQVDLAANELNLDNYKRIMHQLLFVEEGFMKDEISRYTLTKTQLHAQWNIFDEMTGMKCALDNELFGVLYLQEEDALRPDDAAGRLLHRNVSSVWLQLAESLSNKVYEAPVEKVESECVVLRLSSKMCSDLQLYDTCDITVNSQFQLNRWPLCEMHGAVDRLTTGQLKRLVFPDPSVSIAVGSEVKIRWQWLLDQRLNKNQKTVIQRIASSEYNAPPLVVFGPFGTGKTFTLNQAVRLLVQLDKSHRILLCTHSNRAADIHVELLHKYLTEQNGIPAARPLRVYQPMRRLETASETARNYCLIEDDLFLLPSRDDLVEHRVVVTTLSTSKVLLGLQVFHGFFTHILIDEAAQALEPEALTPLVFAGPNTKVVFTGDHMQMSPEVYSPQARKLGLQKSLAERLFDLYDKDKQEVTKQPTNVLFLTENYRCHKDILQFPSDNFYGEKLVARGHVSQPAHPKYGPLLFFSARGKEQKEHDNSYMNLSEVYEVVKRVNEVANNWPSRVWGPRKLSDIAVLSAYRYQVQAIRNSLRKENLKEVKVDTIHNVQGEEFRVLFISTVRTFHTCQPQQEQMRASGSDRQLYWEFLSGPKLLNTAVTRARCLVAVVGDPVSLCTVGECRSIWRDYIKRCHEIGGLHGTTMAELEKEINAAIASIQLNPEAQPFLPKCPSTPEQSVSTSVPGGNNVSNNQEADEETQDEEGNGLQTNVLQERSEKANENDKQNRVDASYTYNMAQNQDEQHEEKQEEKEEEEPDDSTAETGDFQDDLLEDETVSPRYMDEIILAFVKKCEETLKLDAGRRALFEDSEFPPLEASTSKPRKSQSARNEESFSFKEEGNFKDLFPEVRVVNGRVEVRLINLGIYKSPSERAQRIIASTKLQEFLDPSVLRQLLDDEPQKYILCNLRLNPEKSQVGYAQIEDTKTPDIQIKGRVRQAFDKDKVVVELVEKKARSKVDGSEPHVQGKVVGVLEHIISPHERQFVCTTDYETPALMVPINKSATKLVNLTDKSCKDIPIYKKDQNERATKVNMMKREKVLSGKYLFVVKYLQWRRDCSYPLGIVVKTMPKGEDLKTSMEIAYAERGIRRAFKQATMKYVKEKFPPEWSIPENEYASRTSVSKAITIDPPASLDLDDALTIEETSPSTFRVGIHIADISFFVKPNCPLDHEAFLRCTSYYPGEEQENIPMLPRELSEGHCSLLPDKDRLAVSVFVILDEEGRVTEGPTVERTIVRSCCRFSYTEAQAIINERDLSTTEVSVEIKENIRQLSSLAQNRRRYRLGDRAFDHWQNEGIGEFVEAHELVEEMMILANEEVAKRLSERYSELAPLRVQLPPKDHRLAEWIEMYGKYVRLSLQFTKIFQNESSEPSPLNVMHSEKTPFKIQKCVWGAICKAVESCDLPTAHQLICNERNHPQIAAAQTHFRRIQSEARFVCECDQPSEKIQHYSLGMRSYTQFTSPIRRYMDIVVHRLLGLQSGSHCEENMTKDEIRKVCRRSTFLQDNARKFGKDCKRIHMATKLQHRCHDTRVFIESIDKQSISLHFSKPEDDHLAGRQKRLLLSHLNPIALKEEDVDGDGKKSTVLKWRFRKYIAPEAQGDLWGEGDGGIGELAEIPSEIWLRVLDAIRSNDEDKLTTIIKETEAKLNILSPPQRFEEIPQRTSPEYARGEHYKHPHHDDSVHPLSGETDSHFYEKSLPLKSYDFFSVQLCPHMTRGILEPDIQLFKINPHIIICIEHRRYPRESFAHTARHQASRERYGSIDEYINAWKPVLAMEAATGAVKENDGFIIEQINVVWEQENGSVCGLISLPWTYCSSRQLEFYPGDLACVRVPYPNTDSPPFRGTSEQPKIAPDHLVENRGACDFWVGHCIIREVTSVKEKKMTEVRMSLHQAASNVPEGLTNENGCRSTVELIHRTLPQRRMYAALCNRLNDSSELVHAICKGEEPTTEDNFGVEAPSILSLVQYGFQRLNHYQEAAVKEALSKPFTLIQGPPGTGKTVTGVHIAYWFAEQNKRLKSFKVREKDTDETEPDGAYKAPPQIIYCGPSNKAVDVVTEYLMKIPSLNILRVYSDQVEQREFPIPNKLKPARTTRSDDELKISNENIRSVCLHHLIRSPACPYERELRQFKEGFDADKARGEIISQKDVGDYIKLIGQAEKWALQKSGAQIILCTCATAGSPRIINSCDNIQQCIVDECGMCMEPESLVPITCSGARQFVLIGDHKQLQPVIQDHVAKTLGLSVSMFERHSKRALMLRLQYRMHNGICEFPSKQFYEGKLETAEVVKSRRPSPVTFWPAMVRRNTNLPIVFCHVEGQEESAAIATSESNEESKSNMKEVRKAVQIAKYLVNQYKQVRMSDVVILSPYREQRSKISALLKGAYDDILVTTVTKSQGSEWDYVIISLVRSLKKDEIDPEPPQSWLREHLGFLTDEHQMNVGLTRAKRGLCIIGNKHLLCMDEMWSKLIQHYEENHCLVDEKWPWSQ